MDSNYEFCLIGSCTDVGKVRKVNEDSTAVFDAPNGRIVVVCDGMGGHAGGKEASETAILAIKDFLLNNVITDPREAIYHAIMAANNAIVNRTQTQPALAGMGSTCVMLIITPSPDGKVYYGHVGDSRIYVIANRRIKQLTKDHSFVQMLVDKGQITPEQAEHHPRKNEITNALGLQTMQPPTVCSEPIEPEAGNCFLLCSDGLTGMVTDTHIERVISNRSLKIRERAEKLVRLANEAGGVDNITVQLVEFALGTSDISESDKPKPEKRWKKLICILAVILVAGVLAWFGTKWWMAHRDKGEESDNTETGFSEITDSNMTNSFILKDTLNITANPIFFEKKQSQIAEILSDSKDSIYSSTAKVIDKYKDYLDIRKIDGNYITINWKDKDFTGTQIVIMCETEKRWYRATIPVKPSVSGARSAGNKNGGDNNILKIKPPEEEKPEAEKPEAKKPGAEKPGAEKPEAEESVGDSTQ
ncbi:MAG: Stp1/IreP family PP2C-type Ser/Thr phosphatase [Tannerella sp.]|jgi:serine/threonine protein phosphatase PrpC|nr:Stp1/IreP family PP2C-type Ser/Thr phosphatase [Tannerella sp.]